MNKIGFSQKILFTFISFVFILFWLVNVLLNPIITKDTITTTTILWFNIIIPSIIPTYIIGNLLYCYNSFFYPLFLLFKKSMHLETTKSCSLFFLSIILGNPTTTILIINSTNKKEISIEEGNRLLRFTNHVSIIFIILVYGYRLGLLLWFCQLISSFIIASFSKNKRNYQYNTTSIKVKEQYFQIINNIPNVLLTILSTMIFVALLKIPINTITSLFPTNVCIFFQYIISYLEITSGSMFLKTINNTYMLLPLNALLLSTSGLSIILQVLFFLKKSQLSSWNYLKYRFIHGLISSLLSLLVYFLLMIFFF